MKTKRVLVSSLQQDPANARTHDERNLDAIKGSLLRFGQQKPIVVDKNGVVRAGNGTLAAAIALGWTHIEVAETKLEGADAVAYAIADNRSSDLSAFDEELLSALLAEMEPELQRAAGFTEDELSDLMPSPEIDEEMAPPPAATPTTKRGDLWILGDHRLLCGDSSMSDDIDTLLAGARIHLVNTDPPYNVKVEPTR